MNASIRHRWWAAAALRRRVAPVICLVTALQPAHAASSAAAEIVDVRRQPAIEGDAQAATSKNAVCSGCHGPDGNSLLPDFPSLAGQSATYLYLQLRAFKAGSWPSEIMKPQVESLSDQDMKDLAAYYASLSPRAASQPSADTDADADAGRALFAVGDPTRGIPPCQGCHGESAQGVRSAAPASSRPATAWHTYPTLAGQQAGYVIAQLKAYQTGTRGDSSNARVMQAVAETLDEEAMRQIAVYVSQLPRQ
jgi:cytochrome c553